jgi:4a-hydroxytetrahydrobiopterin dehydratase
VTLLSDTEVQEHLARTGGWLREGQGIQRELSFSDFAAALDFLVRVGAVAEAANHHPDMLLHGWNKVRLTLSTHSEGGITAADFELAAQIDRIA